MKFIKQVLAFALALGCGLAFAAVDVNKATQAELEAVKGVGPSLSSSILAERKKASFKDWEDLTFRVKGLKSGKAAKLSDAGLTVNGAPYRVVAPKAAAPAQKPATGVEKAAEKK